MQLEKYNQDVNGNSIQGVNDRQLVYGVISEHCRKEASFNVWERIKRRTRLVLFNVPYNEEDKKDKFIRGFTDFGLVVDLMYHSVLNFQPKYCFSVVWKKCRYFETPSYS